MENNGKGVAIVDLLEPPTGPARVTMVGRNDEAEALRRTLAKLAEMPEVKNGSFEVRYLSCGTIIGSAPTSVLWLKALDGGKDMIFTWKEIPFLQTTPLEPDKLYTAEEFLRILQPRAKSQLEGSQGGPGGRSAG